MPIRFVSGDLFENQHDARAFAHGCNCQGSMGAGIAKTFRARYPEMYEEHRRRCKAEPRLFNLGDCWLWKADDQPWVFNLGTQEGFWRSRASYEAIETSLRAMRVQADTQGLTSIAIPRIGVGYGGLSWKKVRAIVEAVFGDWAGTLILYQEFVPRGAVNSMTDRSTPNPKLVHHDVGVEHEPRPMPFIFSDAMPRTSQDPSRPRARTSVDSAPFASGFGKYSGTRDSL
jgi:O-acetyl-ADP-ribose deacetylase (regulator of RNase III)